MDDDACITAYKQDDFIDLCRGPHLESVKELKNYIENFNGETSAEEKNTEN